ncbi:hypothetical protein COU56_01595 [Candidatus Pacearchaeota archaeon CG10_big_fil_rev_8_21_14_0_10_31_9]|nr:MAG: hypothetical protein COU56_01595 [Candidatus Pacearchaeota archaeon CG10_big_fil_rev_8_21_14_0_10_31_9]
MGKKIFYSSIIFILIVFLSCIVFAENKPLVYNLDPLVPQTGNLNFNGDVSVNLYSGATVFSYPLKIPLGTNNLQPMLSLKYNSYSTKNKQSIIGSGWSISESYIQRDTNFTFSNISDDEFKLTFNGATYNLIYSQDDNRFHTEIESFFYMKNQTGGDNEEGEYWILKTKGGTTYRFGFYNFSETMSNQYNYVWRWNLDLVNDTYGNKIFYNYSENPYLNDKGTVYIDKISYNNDKKREINFIYEPVNRPDLILEYDNGNEVKISRRLSQIIVNSSDSLVRKYKLEYETLEEVETLSFLSNITEYGSNGQDLLPPTKFSYNSVKSGWQNESSWKTPDSICFVDNGYEDNGIRFIDLNGDALIDLLVAEESPIGNCEADIERKSYINNGTNWVEDDTWIPPACFINSAKEDMGIRLIDFNGDGLTDILKGKENIATCGDSERQAWINNGSGWMQDDSWETPRCFTGGGHEDEGLRLADFNGDNLPDIILALQEGGDRLSWINNGTGWQSTGSWISTEDFVDTNRVDKGARLIDVNGDNLPDIIFGEEDINGNCRFGLERRAWVNNGTNWTRNDIWAPPACFVDNGNEDNGIRLGDVNGDNLIDLLVGEESANGDCRAGLERHSYVNNGSGWIRNDSWQPKSCFVKKDPAQKKDLGIRIADINGDGMIEIVESRETPGGSCSLGTKSTYMSNATKSYLLNSITFSLGGETLIDYRKSSGFNNSGNNSLGDLGFNVLVVANITKDNGVDGTQNFVSFTNYNYSGGMYDYKDKEFRGFSYVEEKTGNKTIRHWFHQDDARQGREYKTQVLDASNNIYKAMIINWSFTKPDNYFIVELSEQSESDYDGQLSNPKIKNISYEYGAFGNVITVHNKGDVSDLNDDKYEYFNYLSNSDLWIVDKIKNYSLFSSDNTVKIRESLYAYDNLAYGEAPTKGSLTSKEDFLDTGDNPLTRYNYSEFGNLVNETDSNGNRTEYVYGIRDATNTYIDGIINSKGHISDYNYALGTGNLINQTNSNGNTTIYIYDIFGRIIKEIQPYDSEQYPTKNYTYEYDGVAPEKAKISQREESGAGNTFDQYTFYDGFEKVIQTKNEADNNQQIVLDTYYDEFQRVRNQSNPYFATTGEGYTTPNQTVSKTIFSYDPLDRVILVINPDGTRKNINYNHWNITFLDENNNQKNHELDAYGQIVKVREYNKGNIYTTVYSYDTAGNLLSIKDNLNNLFNYTYDSLGRKIRQRDPDLGIWNYSYDKNNNLILQTDNRNNTVFLSYDGLNRITNKSSDNEEIIYLYDANKNNTLAQIKINSNGNIITNNFSYDDRLRKIQEIKIIEDKLFLTVFSYDDLNRVKTKTLPDKNIQTYSYDTQGLLNEIDGILTIEYNEQNSPTSRLYNNNLQTNFSYNIQNFRLNQIKTGNLQNLTYRYDSIGNILGINDSSNGKVYSMLYDNIDRLTYTNISDKANNNENILNYAYNSIGNMMNISRNSNNITFYYLGSQVHAVSGVIGVSDSGNLPDDSYKFYIKDSLGNNVSWFGSEGNIVLKGTCYVSTNCITNDGSSFTIGNATDNTTAFINSTGDLCIEKGDCGDLSPACNSPSNDAFIIKNSSSNVAYIDYNGDLCLTGGLYENSNIASGTQIKNLTYDANGNLISDGTFNHSYNSFNQLVNTTNSNDKSLVNAYLYDDGGNRLVKIDYNIDSNKNNKTTYYLGDLIHIRITNGTTFNHPDHLGSTTLVTNSSGNEIEEEFYLPFGGILEGDEESRYLFTGKERDKTTNLDYFGARYYDSELRHFVQADSVIQDVFNPKSLNHYSYVFNNPYSYLDPSGRLVEVVTRRLSNDNPPLARLGTHSYFDITPDNPEDFKGETNFQIGAYNVKGKLKSEINAENTDATLEVSRTAIEIPGGEDTEVINALISEGVKLNEADVPYQNIPFFPGPGENSNVFVSTVISNIGVNLPEGVSYQDMTPGFHYGPGLGNIINYDMYIPSSSQDKKSDSQGSESIISKAVDKIRSVFN